MRNRGTIKSSSSWKPVELDTELLSAGDFDGLVGIEELTDYTYRREENDSEVSDKDDSDKEDSTQRLNGKKKKKSVRDRIERDSSSLPQNQNFSPTKAVDKGLEVDSVVVSTSRWEANTLQTSNSKNLKKHSSDHNPLVIKTNVSGSKYNTQKKRITSKNADDLMSPTASMPKKEPILTPKIGRTVKSSVSLEEKDKSDVPLGMDAWNSLGVPIPVLHALAEMKFTTPTSIQALTLPAAIFGRRDILGAAETGSGKTLAFGIPILCGISHDKLKEDALAETLPPHDVPSESFNVNKFDASSDSNDSYGEIDDFVEDDSSNHSKDEAEMPYDEDESDVSELDISEEDLIEEGSKEKAELVKVIDNADFDFLKGGKELKSIFVKKPLYALILTPTRELAIQVSEHLKSVAKYTGISTAVVVGGMSSQKQNRLLNRAPEIIVATPGRLWDLISEGHPHLMHVEKIRYLAIDETDRMLEKGHFDELQRLLERINADDEQKLKRQNFVFSATLSLTHDVPSYVKTKKKSKKKAASKITAAKKLSNIIETVGLTNPKVVDITESSGVAYSLTEAHIVCSLEEKDYYLYYFLLRYPGRTLVFCNSINCVKRLAQLFSLLKCPTSPLHAHMHQTQRLKNLERFRDNPQCVLLATDVAARGLDIPKVQHVIHYQVPSTAESYVHRSGRTARAHQEGLTVIFVEPGEIRNFSRLFRTLGREPVLPVFPVEEKYMTAVKQRVNLARQLELHELQERRTTSERGWIGKLAKEMDIEISDKEDSDDEESFTFHQGASSRKKNAAQHRKQLNSMLEKPIFPKGFSFKFPSIATNDAALSTNSILNEEQGDKSAISALKQDVERKRAEKRKHNNKISGHLQDKIKRVS